MDLKHANRSRSGSIYSLKSVLKTALLLLVFAISFIGAWPGSAAEAAAKDSGGSVFVIPVKMKVQNGLQSFLNRSLAEAEAAKASLVVLDIDTPGGRLDSAEKIGARIRESTVPTVAFVTGKAASAGAYIALNAGGIAMSPASAIGAAMIVDQAGRQVKDAKLVPFWTQEMVAAAELNNRNAAIATAMVDPDRSLELKELGRTKKQGEVLALSAEEALKVGYAEKIAKTKEEVIAWKGLSDRSVVEIHPTLAEKVSIYLTSAGISTLLLIIGIAGVVMELLVPGFGIPGIIGLLAFGLYFFGQAIAGFAGTESIALFILGIVLLLLEIFVPSFGILGLLGGAGVVTGITMGAYDTGNAFQALGIAVLVASVFIIAFAYVFRQRGVWNKFILRDQLTKEQGYVPDVGRQGWVGLEGVSLSELRPSGVAEIEGRRVDVLTSGEFIERGRPVRIVAADGTRIVVKESKQG
jgi:membrane-bound serine protease (ClpP class)